MARKLKVYPPRAQGIGNIRLMGEDEAGYLGRNGVQHL
jgi:hypothetical protein